MMDNEQINNAVNKFCKILAIITNKDEKDCIEIWDDYYHMKIDINTLTNKLHDKYEKNYVDKAKQIIQMEEHKYEVE